MFPHGTSQSSNGQQRADPSMASRLSDTSVLKNKHGKFLFQMACHLPIISSGEPDRHVLLKLM
jgi:hypothetical protein